MPANIDHIANLPYLEINFDRDGTPQGPDEDHFANALAVLADKKPTDLLIFSHGWRNDEQDARTLYHDFFTNFAAALPKLPAAKVGGRSFVIAGLFWPSMPFSERVAEADGTGPAAGLGSPVDEAELCAQLDQLKTALDTAPEQQRLDSAKGDVFNLDDPASQARFVDKVRSLLPQPPVRSADTTEDANHEFFGKAPDDLLNELAVPFLGTGPALEPDSGGQATAFEAPEFTEDSTQRAAASLGDVFGGIKAGAMRFLNYSSYYVMKERAGTVGRVGLSAFIRAAQKQASTLKVHLIGHSFGGRLVTAAALALVDVPAAHVDSMSLLQAAYSHNGLGTHFDGNLDGFFRSVVKPAAVVNGPTIITHSRQDSAVGVAYPIASRLSNNDSSGLGDSKDRFGGMGRNGAQFTPEATFDQLLAATDPAAYDFKSGHIHNLNGDTLITGHGDVTSPHVARAVATAVAAT